MPRGPPASAPALSCLQGGLQSDLVLGSTQVATSQGSRWRSQEGLRHSDPPAVIGGGAGALGVALGQRRGQQP